MARSIDRKRRTSESQLKEALSQVAGALRYIGVADPVLLSCKGEDVDFYLADREVVGLAVIKEIFATQSVSIVSALQACKVRGQRLVILDFPGFSAFVHHFPVEDQFVAALKSYSDAILEGNEWIAAKTFLNGQFLGSY